MKPETINFCRSNSIHLAGDGEISVAKMVAMQQDEVQSFDSPGSRLSHLLDRIGFKEQRGKMQGFYQYLRDKDPENFGDLSYSTVRGWFSLYSPSIKKIAFIVDALKQNYRIPCDEKHLKTWWKLGGIYPFYLPEADSGEELATLELESKETQNKLLYQIMRLISEEDGSLQHSLTQEEILSVLGATTDFARDFADPKQTSAPQHYLRAIIRDQIARRADIES